MREVMKFLIPVSVSALGKNDLTGRVIVPMYIGPNSFDINKTKNINNTLTKAGFAVQYWGEQLTTVSIRGTTGSGGIEAINILDAVYRNEIIQFNKILQERAARLDSILIESMENKSQTGLTNGIISVFDEITNGGVSDIIRGTETAVNSIVDAALGVSASNSERVELMPSIGSFAINMIIYFQGVKYTGYFEDFSYNENSEKPGLFEYNFKFVVIKQYGTRKNFMPWHRRPTDFNNEPVPASIPLEGAREDELSIAPPNTIFNGQINSRLTDFPNEQVGEKIINAVPLNRNALLKGK